MAPVPTVDPAPLVRTHEERNFQGHSDDRVRVLPLWRLCGPSISRPTCACERLRDLYPLSSLPGQAATSSSCADNRTSIASLHETVSSPARKANRGGSMFSADSFHDSGGWTQSPTVARIQSFVLRLVLHRAYRNSSRHCCTAALFGFCPGISCTAGAARTFTAPDSS